MKLIRFFIFMMILTGVSLVYIHLQVQIFDLAYEGKKKEREIKKLVEEREATFYNVCRLKSVNRIGERWLSNKSEMRFLDNTDVIEVALSQEKSSKRTILSASAENSRGNFWTSIFSLKSQAEAKPIR